MLSNNALQKEGTTPFLVFGIENIPKMPKNIIQKRPNMLKV
jgi:hypothetical protein